MRAFWKYDLFPYFLSGTVGELKAGDKVTIPSYGITVSPVLMLSGDDGLQTSDRLDELAKEYNNEKIKLKNDYLKKAKQIAPFLYLQLAN